MCHDSRRLEEYRETHTNVTGTGPHLEHIRIRPRAVFLKGQHGAQCRRERDQADDDAHRFEEISVLCGRGREQGRNARADARNAVTSDTVRAQSRGWRAGAHKVLVGGQLQLTRASAAALCDMRQQR